MINSIKIGSRKSLLAKTQARYIAHLIETKLSLRTNLVWIVTSGDKLQRSSPSLPHEDKGIFIKEIELALRARTVDIAVHSLKDLPVDIEDDFKLAAIPKRENPFDAWISKDKTPLDKLKQGARIGTGSIRRMAFLMNRFPELEVVPIRGNVDTRLKKIEIENLDGVILAAAGIYRLGYDSYITNIIPQDVILPAPGQGALGIETRANDKNLISALSKINDSSTDKVVGLERQLLKRLGGGCQVPLGIFARYDDKDNIILSCEILSKDGKKNVTNSIVFDNHNDSDVILDQMMIEIDRSGGLDLL